MGGTPWLPGRGDIGGVDESVGVLEADEFEERAGEGGLEVIVEVGAETSGVRARG